MGRGLEALLGKVATQQAEDQTAALDNTSSGDVDGERLALRPQRSALSSGTVQVFPP